jgi:parallel beta-helix repeat protein
MQKRGTTLFVVVLILIISNTEIAVSTQFLSKNLLQSNAFDVCLSDNRILNVGGSGFDNYSHIQVAINLASDGDTVFVWDDSSPYFENIVIDKKIMLKGENRTSTIIDGMGIDDVIIIHADGVMISGFTIKNSKKEWINAGIVLFSDNNFIYDNIIYNAENGVYSYDLDYTIIENNIISQCEHSGINIPFSSNNIIRYNRLSNCGNYGVFIYDSLYDVVTDNVISDSGVGVHLWYSFYNNISSNIVANNGIGLRFSFYSKNNTIIHNVLQNNAENGIELNFSFYDILQNNVVENSKVGVKLYYSNENYIKNSNIVSECVIGFDVVYSPDNIISGNIIKNNSYGINLSFSSNNSIEYNYIEGSNELGIYFSDGSNNNRIYHNAFISNEKNAFFMNSVFNRWDQNYWDDYGGKAFYVIDGVFYFGESVLHVSWVNIDFSPRNEPYENSA